MAIALTAVNGIAENTKTPASFNSTKRVSCLFASRRSKKQQNTQTSCHEALWREKGLSILRLGENFGRVMKVEDEGWGSWSRVMASTLCSSSLQIHYVYFCVRAPNEILTWFLPTLKNPKVDCFLQISSNYCSI